ncbi:MAG TPA: cupredoxin family copper-binding protein [Herpetosiphonaceae bacterium]
MSRVKLLIVAPWLLLLAVSALDASSQVQAVSSRNVAISAVDIVDFAYQPDSGVSSVGASVTWTNRGSFAHTVTFDSGAADSGTLTSGQSFTFKFPSAGRYSYHCAIHPAMTGYVDALPPSGPRLPRSWLPLVTH